MLSRHLLRLLFHFCNFDLSKWGPARNRDCYFALSNAPEPGELPTYQIPGKVRDVLFWTSKELLPQATPVSAAKALLEGQSYQYLFDTRGGPACSISAI